MRGPILKKFFLIIWYVIYYLICHILFFHTGWHAFQWSQDPRGLMRAFFTPVFSWALPGSPGLSSVLGDMQVKEMSREMGFSNQIARWSSLRYLVNKMSLLSYIREITNRIQILLCKYGCFLTCFLNENCWTNACTKS